MRAPLPGPSAPSYPNCCRIPITLQALAMTFVSSLWFLVAALVVAGGLVGGLVARTQRKRARARANQMLDPRRNSEWSERLEQRLSELDGRFTKVDAERRELLRTQRELTVLIETREAELSASQGALREKSESLATLAREKERLAASSSEQSQLAARAQTRAAALESENQSLSRMLAEERVRALELERSAADVQGTAHQQLEHIRLELRASLTDAERTQLEANAKIASLAAQVGARDAELEALARALTEIRDAVAAREQEAGALRCALAAGRNEADAAKERCGELEREAAAAEARAEQDGAQLALLQRQVVELTGRMGEREAELAQTLSVLEQQALHANQDAIDANQRAADAERRLGEHAAQRARLERELQARDAELTAATERAAAFEQRNCELDQAKEALDARVSELQAQAEEQLASSNERIASLEERLVERSAELSRLHDELRARADELAQVNTRASAAEQRGREAHQSCDALDIRLSALQAQTSQAAAASNERIAELERQLAERESEAGRLAGELEARGTALAAQTALGSGAQARCNELERELSECVERLNTAQRRVGELEAHLEARVHELQGHIDGCDRELERRAQALASMQGELEQRRVGLEGAQAQLANTQQRCEALATQLEALERGLAEQTSSRAALAREFEMERAALTERHANESSAAEHRAEQLRARVESLEQALAQREGQLAQREDERRALGELSAELEVALEVRALELVEREQLLDGVRSEAETLAADVERWRAHAALEKASLDELASARLTAVLGRRNSGGVDSLPEAYLEGLGERDLAAAVRGLLGDAQPLSPASFERLGEHWSEQHAAWRSAPLEREVVYLWLDGLKVKAGLSTEDDSLLLAVAGLADGSKAVVAAECGPRDSVEAWSAVLEQLRARAMTTPRIVVADAQLGAWEALRNQGFDGARQLCWGYELDALVRELPERSRQRATQLLRRIVNAPDRAKAVQLRSTFLESYSKRCPQVAERLSKHWRELTAFFAFPEDHWVHLRSTTTVTSALDALRLAGGGAKPAVPTPHGLAILWRLLIEAERRGRRLNGAHKLAEVAQMASSSTRRRRARA